MNRLIDVHTHLFNGFYVPLEEILDHKAPLPRGLAKTFARIIKELIGSPLLGGEEGQTGWLGMRDGEVNPDDVAYALVDAIQRKFDEEVKSQNRLDTLERQKESKLHTAVVGLVEQDAIDSGVDRPEGFFGDDIIDAFTEESEPAREMSRLRLLKGLMGLLEKVIIKILTKNGGEVAVFVLKMLSSDEVLFDELVNHNYQGSDLPALTIHHTMDMEPAYYWRNNSVPTISPEYPFDDVQIKRSAGFIKEAQGRLLGFAAFHPLRDLGSSAQRGRRSLELCQEARKRGHIGVKIYPPMNYMPNEWERYPVLRQLYQWCCDQDIPIMSHCTPEGFEAWSGTGVCSDPLYWAEVLKEYPNLRLCFGHAGGGNYDNIAYNQTGEMYPDGEETVNMDGWYSTRTHWKQAGNPCYPRTVVKLCRKYKNVYCDMSYLTAIMKEGKKKKRFLANFKAAMADSGKFKFYDKVMYGTDWHMMEMVRHTQQFLDSFREIFEDHDWLDDDMADKFFFRNAVKFLNLPDFIAMQSSVTPAFFSAKAIKHLKAVVAKAESGP